ncbi:MAG: Uncharacterized protein LiPW15_792 [Parcubacteria group bacterium LiPW_15]|nr:MAG: Uncharacterized protein LiPW15_792 [Parcubacteria group bacterium LiPW_15]
MKPWLKKFLVIFPLLFFFVLILSAPSAHALFTIGDIGAKAVGTVLQIVSYMVTFIAGIAVAVISWAIGVVLNMSLGAVNSPTVQGGYNVTLAIANLGFILGVIIVAIATILRNQTYGVKTLLYKVVVMAVLVNFGLVLAGGLINISNGFTQYFLDSITGGKGAASVLKFSDTMTGAFQPQSFLSPYSKADAEKGTADVAQEFSVSGEFYKMLRPQAAFVMMLIAMVLIIITLAAFLVMLVIRYVTLVILLILLPLAWMAWSFPYLSKHFQTWWSKFIQQILFPPVAIFFLWLALTVSKNAFSAAPSTSTVSSTNINGIGSLLSAIALPLLDVVVLSAMMIGGLMAAQTLGVEFAATGMKWAEGAKGWALKRGGRAIARDLSRPFQGKAAQERAQGWMKSGNYLQRMLGRGVTMAARPGGVDQVADYEKQYGGLSKDQLLEEFRADPLGHSANSRAALLNLLQKQNALGDLTSDEITKYVAGYSSGEEKEEDYKKNEELFARLGQGKSLQAIRDTTGVSARKNFKDLETLNGEIRATTDQATKDDIQKKIDKATQDLQKSMSKISSEALAGFFRAADAEAKKNPLGLSKDEFDKFKENLARTMVGPNGITAGRYSSFLSDLQTKGDPTAIEAFKKANEGIAVADINEGIKNWLGNNGARNLGVTLEGYYPNAGTAVAAVKITREEEAALAAVSANAMPAGSEEAYDKAQKKRIEELKQRGSI